MQLSDKKERKYPKGVDGRKIRTKRFWYNNGIENRQLVVDIDGKIWLGPKSFYGSSSSPSDTLGYDGDFYFSTV